MPSWSILKALFLSKFISNSWSQRCRSVHHRTSLLSSIYVRSSLFFHHREFLGYDLDAQLFAWWRLELQQEKSRRELTIWKVSPFDHFLYSMIKAGKFWPVEPAVAQCCKICKNSVLKLPTTSFSLDDNEIHHKNEINLSLLHST